MQATPANAPTTDKRQPITNHQSPITNHQTMPPTLFTIGHSTHTPERFLELLALHSITAVADVRSSPYSRHTPQFNREALSEMLKRSGIAYVFLGAFVYGFVYTVWLKHRSWLNIVLGGLSGSFAVLAGAAAVAPGLSPVPVILALVLFLWTPPHFWSLATVLHQEYRRAGVPMLPVVAGDRIAAWVILGHTVALVLLSLAPLAYGMGPIYLVGAGSGGVYFIATSAALVRRPGVPAASRNFRASLVQLSLLLLAAIIDRWLFA